MANSNLEGKFFSPSDKVIAQIEKAVLKYDVESRANGFARAKNILKTKKISYEQMKRIKNYFDNYEGDGTDIEFKLNGGHTMKKWNDEALKTGRDVIHKEKKARMDGGEENQFIKTHEKDKDNADPTRVRMAKIHKGSKLRNIMSNDTIYEEVESIKYLIGYMDNNNNNKNNQDGI